MGRESEHLPNGRPLKVLTQEVYRCKPVRGSEKGRYHPPNGDHAIDSTGHTTLLPQHRALHTCHHSVHLDDDTYFLPASPARGCLHSRADAVFPHSARIPMHMSSASPLLLHVDARFSRMRMPASPAGRRLLIWPVSSCRRFFPHSFSLETHAQSSGCRMPAYLQAA